MSTSSIDTPTTPSNTLQQNYFNSQQQQQSEVNQNQKHYHTTTALVFSGSDAYRKALDYPDVYGNVSDGGNLSMAMNEQEQQIRQQTNISYSTAHTLLTPSSSTSSSSSAVVGASTASTAAAIHNHQQLQQQQQEAAQFAATTSSSTASSQASSYSQSSSYMGGRAPPTMSGSCLQNGSNVKRNADVSICSSVSSCCSSAASVSVTAAGVNAVTPVITQKMSRTIPPDMDGQTNQRTALAQIPLQQRPIMCA